MADGAAGDGAAGQPGSADAWGRSPRFDAALLRVSNCLAEAEDWGARGMPQRAERLFRVAEAFALRTGYLELVRLVWAYDGMGMAAGRSGGAA